jgi:DNA-binding transcriptional LysR family regulator
MTRVREGVAISSATNSNSLGTSASALSQSVRTLERRMGVQLLNRTTRHVRLTEHGARFLEQLLPGLNQVETALSSLEESRLDPAGVLRINLPRVAATLLVMPMLRAFHQRIQTFVSSLRCAKTSSISSPAVTTPESDWARASRRT